MTRGQGFALHLRILLTVVAVCLPLVACAPSVASKQAEIHDSIDVWSVALSPDGQHLAVSSPDYEEVHVWQWRDKTPRIVQKLQQGGGGQLDGLRFSRDGKFLAGAHGTGKENQIVRIWSGETWVQAGDIAEPKAGAFPLTIAHIEFTPETKFLVRVSPGGWLMDGTTKVILDSFAVYDTNTWSRVWALATQPVLADALALSSDGRFAAVAGMERFEREGVPHLQAKLFLIDLTEKRIVFAGEVLPTDCMVQFVAWSPDGHRIAIGGDPGESPTPLPALETFDVDAQRGIKIYPSRGHMTALNYSEDGKYLLVGWLIEGVEIWDAAHTKLLQRISGRVTAARFSGDGRHLATAIDGDVTIWDMK